MSLKSKIMTKLQEKKHSVHHTPKNMAKIKKSMSKGVPFKKAHAKVPKKKVA